MKRVLAYVLLVLSVWMFAGGVLALVPGLLWKLILIPEFWIPLAANFAAAALFAALWWYLKSSR